MNKQQFITELESRLSGCPKEEVQERLSFYAEMIDDRMEEGLSEEDAVQDIGSVEQVAAQIIADIPLVKILKNKMKRETKMQTWKIVLLTCTAPIWISLLVSAFAVVLSLYVSVWACIVSLWASNFAIAVSAVAGLMMTGVYIALGKWAVGLFLLGAALVCAGLAIFFFYACRLATKGVCIFTKQIVLLIKHKFI